MRTIGITPATAASKRSCTPGLAGDAEELVAVLGEQLLVGGDDRLARPRSASSTKLAGGLGPPHQLDDQVGALEDLAEVALASG